MEEGSQILCFFLCVVFTNTVTLLFLTPSLQLSMADQGNVQTCESTEMWLNKLYEAMAQSKLMIVDFTAAWCGPCRFMVPCFIELSKKYPNAVFLKVDVDNLPDVTAQWDIQAMPTFIIIKDGKEVERIVGANKQELERKIALHARNM